MISSSESWISSTSMNDAEVPAVAFLEVFFGLAWRLIREVEVDFVASSDLRFLVDAPGLDFVVTFVFAAEVDFETLSILEAGSFCCSGWFLGWLAEVVLLPLPYFDSQHC